MRQRHIIDVGRLQPDLGELAFERLLDGPDAGLALLAVGHLDDVVADAGVVQHPAFGVLDQIAGDGEVARAARARREGRSVVEVDVATIEHVHPLDARLSRLSESRLREGDERRCDECEDRGVSRRQSFHIVFLPSSRGRRAQYAQRIAPFDQVKAGDVVSTDAAQCASAYCARRFCNSRECSQWAAAPPAGQLRRPGASWPVRATYSV